MFFNMFPRFRSTIFIAFSSTILFSMVPSALTQLNSYIFSFFKAQLLFSLDRRIPTSLKYFPDAL